MATEAPTFHTLTEAEQALHDIDPQGFEQDAACDIIAEITGEAAAFGDSAPGSGEQLAAARAFLAEVRHLRQEVARLTPVADVDFGDDEPF